MPEPTITLTIRVGAERKSRLDKLSAAAKRTKSLDDRTSFSRVDGASAVP